MSPVIWPSVLSQRSGQVRVCYEYLYVVPQEPVEPVEPVGTEEIMQNLLPHEQSPQNNQELVHCANFHVVHAKVVETVETMKVVEAVETTKVVEA